MNKPSLAHLPARRRALAVLWLVACAVLAGCAASGPPLQRPAAIDLDRFDGEWYVIANIPYFAERGNVDARVQYLPRDDGRFDDIYIYRDGSFDAPEERREGIAWIRDPGRNTQWTSRFVWPFTFDFDVLFVDAGYRHLLLGHPSRDYAWVMAREPSMDDAIWRELLARLQAQGFDPARLRKVPQRDAGP